MILSQQSLFSDNQAVTATAVSTNVLDTGEPGTPTWGQVPFANDVALGTPVEILVQVTESFATLTSLTITVETGTSSSLGTVLSSNTIVLADLVAGKRLPIRFLPAGCKRYIGVRYTVTGSNATAGKVTAGVTAGVPSNVHGV